MKSQSVLRFVFSVVVLGLGTGCDSTGDRNNSSNLTEAERLEIAELHQHGYADALHWPKKDVEHSEFSVSFGHHGNHWHGGEQIEPAVAIARQGKDIGDAKVVCQLLDGDVAIGLAEDMVFEPKTDEEPAHYAGAKLTFPENEKNYLVRFEILLDGSEKISETIEVRCGH